jgi:DNA-binding beta-propeller fold protein YncE
LHGSSAKLVRTEALSGEPFGLTLSPNGRFLLVANYLGGLEVLNAAALEAGKTPFVAAHLPARGTGSDEVVVTPNGRYAFVPEEESDAIAVYSLGELLSWPITKTGPPPKQLGSVPVGSSPSGIALARGGKTLYVVSQTPIHGPATAPGQLASISVSAAEQTPADAVIGTINAGCDPVRVALAPSGESAWVTDRGGNSLLGFKLSTGSRPRVGQLEAEVRVGPEPVDATFVDSGSIVLVTDSDRYGAPEKNQTVAVINVTDALAHRPSLVGYLPAGAFPRQFGQVPGGRILFTDYDSDDVRLIGSADLNWLRSQ